MKRFSATPAPLLPSQHGDLSFSCAKGTPILFSAMSFNGRKAGGFTLEFFGQDGKVVMHWRAPESEKPELQLFCDMLDVAVGVLVSVGFSSADGPTARPEFPTGCSIDTIR